MNCMCSVNYY